MWRMLLFLWALMSALPVLAHEYLIGDLAIVHPHTPPTGPEGSVAKGYMELFNGGAVPERLLAVRSGIADVSFFDPKADDGAGARLADAIEIAPGQSVLLGPDTLQIRFAGLEEGFRIGDKFLATLVFEEIGQITVEFWVEGVAEIPVVVAPETLPDPLADADITRDITAKLRERLGSDTEVAAVSVEGAAAVVGWIRDEDAGRAFLRRLNDDWQLQLLSGESLISPAGLRAQGLSPRVAKDLMTKIQDSEAELPEQTVSQLNMFQGTLIVADK